MRTTIELTDEQRAGLLQIAATRQMKGFSTLVQEAVDLYLAHHETNAERVREALSAFGTLDDEEADALVESARRARKTWR